LTGDEFRRKITPVKWLGRDEDVHQVLVADPTFFWEGGSDGCFARALLVVDRTQREGISPQAIGKLLVVHKAAPGTGWNVQTRLAGTQSWIQHVAATIETTGGPYVIDPTLSDTAEPEQQWLERFPHEVLNPAVAPTPRFLQTPPDPEVCKEPAMLTGN
jgi:hypothetical protein